MQVVRVRVRVESDWGMGGAGEGWGRTESGAALDLPELLLLSQGGLQGCSHAGGRGDEGVRWVRCRGLRPSPHLGRPSIHSQPLHQYRT